MTAISGENGLLITRAARVGFEIPDDPINEHALDVGGNERVACLFAAPVDDPKQRFAAFQAFSQTFHHSLLTMLLRHRMAILITVGAILSRYSIGHGSAATAPRARCRLEARRRS